MLHEISDLLMEMGRRGYHAVKLPCAACKSCLSRFVLGTKKRADWFEADEVIANGLDGNHDGHGKQ